MRIINTKKVKLPYMIGVLLVISLVIVDLTIHSIYRNDEQNTSSTEVLNETKLTNEQHYELATTLQVVHDPEYTEPILTEVAAIKNERKVIISNYFIGDGSSGEVTASGLSIHDFEVSSEGYYLYQDKLVIATAGNRLEGLKDGFVAHDLFDELTLEFDGIEYESIVLDVCGECTWGNDFESLQRVDVFTTGNFIGKVEGIIHE